MAIGKEIKVVLTLDDRGFKVGVRDASGQLTNFASQIEKTSKSVGSMEKSMNSFGNTAHRMIMTVGMARFALMDISSIFLSFPKSVLKTSGEIERLSKLMEGLSDKTGDAAKKLEAAANVKMVFNLAQNAPFEVKALADAFVKLKTGGLDPTNGSLQALVDGVAKFGGTSDQMHRASIAIQQMGGKGVVSMEELRQQLGEAVPTAMKAMAEGMDMTMAELTNAVSKGTVASTGAMKKMLAVMSIQNSGAAAGMMDTWVGMLEQLKTRWELFKLEVGNQGLFDGAKTELKKLLELFKTEQAGAFARSIGTTISGVAESIVGLTKTIIDMWDWIKIAGQAFLTYWAASKIAGPLMATVGAIGSVATQMKLFHAQSLAMAEDEARTIAARAAAKNKQVLDWIAANEKEIAAEGVKAAELKALQQKQIADEIAKNEAILAVNRKRILEAALLERQVAMSPAVRAVASGTATAAQDLEAQVLQRRAERTKEAAVQAGLYSAKLQDQTAILHNQAAALNSSSAAITNKGQRLTELNNVLSQTVKHYEAKAGAITATNNAMTLAQSAIGATMGFLKNLIFSMNGVILIIMAAVTAWDYFSSKAKEASRNAKEALALRDRLERGTNTKESQEQAAGGIKKRKEDLGTLDKQIKYLEGVKYPTDATDAQLESLYAKRKEQLAQLKEIEANFSKGEKAVLVKAAEQRAADIVQTSSMEAEKTAKALATQRVEMVKARDLLGNKATKAEDEAFKAKLREVDTQIFKTKRDALDKQAKEYRELAKSAKAGGEDALAYAQAASDLDKRSADISEMLVSRLADKDILPGKPKKPKAEPKPKEDPKTFPTDDLLNAINADEKKLLKAEQKFDKINGAIIDIAALREQANEQIDLIINQDRRKDIVHTADEESFAKKLRLEVMLMEETVKLQSALVPKLAASRETLNELQGQIARGDFRDQPVSEESKTLREMKRLVALSPEAAAAMKPVIEMMEKYVDVSKNIDVSKGIIENEKNLKDMRVASIQDARAQLKAEGAREVADVEAKYAQLLSKAAQFSEDHKRLEEQRAEEVALINKKLAIALETPMEKLARDWKKTYEQLEEAEANWANSFVDMMVDSLGTGRMEMGKFLKGILADIAKMQMKQAMAEPMKNIMGFADKWLKEKVFPNAGPAAQGIAAAAVKLPDDGSSNAAEMAKLTRQQGALADTTAEATDAVQAFAVEGVDMGTRSILENTLKQATGAATMTTFNSAVVNATAALQTMASMGGAGPANGGAGMLASFLKGSTSGAAGPGMAAGATGGMDMGAGGDLMSIFGFANGGIMTSAGALELRKYAKGGIANTPQLALYGEAGPEAYVPLPDGRTIPVTLNDAGQGGAAPAVTVNVINQSGQPVNAEQSGMRFDGKAYILDVVMTAARTPGGFRQGLKEAVMK